MESTAAGAGAPRVAAPSTLERWAPAAGSLFAALFVLAVIVTPAGLDIGEKLPEVTRNFATEDYRSTAGFVFILVLLSALCFLWFLADLTASVRSLSQGMLASLVPVAGVAFIMAIVAAAAIFLTPLVVIGHSELGGGDPKTAATMYILLMNVGLAMVGFAGIAGALLMSAAATVTYRGGLLPRRALIVIVIGAILAALGTWMFFVPILFVVLWVLVASVMRTRLVRRGITSA
jgi:hypothetical protein